MPSTIRPARFAGATKWETDACAGVLTTDSGLTFTGDIAGNVLALDTSNGKTLWHAGTGVAHGEFPNHLRTGQTSVRGDQQRRRDLCLGLAGERPID